MALGRDVIFDYLGDLGVEYLFGVPGTNEIPIIDGTAVPGSPVKYIPCLHENIAMGAATGYARMTGKPGVVLLHVTPGAGHGLGNLFNAFKSHGPLLVLCGQQQSELILQEPLLASDLVRVAQQYTKWAYEVRSPQELPLALQRALKVAIAPPTGPVFLSIPWDFTLVDVVWPGPGKVTQIAPHFSGDPTAVAAAADRLASARAPIIVAGDGVGYADAWAELQTLAELLGAHVYSETLSSMMNYPNSLPEWQGELPGLQLKVQEVFADCDVAFLCGFNAQAQVVVFEPLRGPLIPESVTQVYLHNDPWEIGKNHYGEVAVLGDIKATLPLLCEAIGQHPALDPAAAEGRKQHLGELASKRDELFAAHGESLARANAARLATASETPAITGAQVAQTLGQLQEELDLSLVYVHEAISDSPYFQKYLQYPTPTSYYSVEGGSLGYSMPASLGIKLAVGEQRLVVNAVGDGSALFYPQVWWTAAKFNLPILTVILNNREYKTLLMGLQQVTQLYPPWQPTGDPWYLHLEQPPLSFPQIAASFGVDLGDTVADPAALRDALIKGLDSVQQGRPYVLEVRTDPSLPPTDVPEPRLDVVQAAKEGML